MGTPYNIQQEWLKLGLDDSFMAFGGCKDADLQTQRKFFAENGRGIAAKMDIVEAKKICLSCGVREECLEYAIAADINHGVWGATLPEERLAIRKRRSSSSAAPGPSTKSAPCTPSSIVPSPMSGAPQLVG